MTKKRLFLCVARGAEACDTPCSWGRQAAASSHNKAERATVEGGLGELCSASSPPARAVRGEGVAWEGSPRRQPQRSHPRARAAKGYSSTYLAMGFANVRAGTWYPPEH